MIHIDPYSPKIKAALKKHVAGLQNEVEKRLEKIILPRNQSFLNDVIKPKINLLLSGSPADLININEEIKRDRRYRASVPDIKAIFTYESWFDQKKKRMYDAYNLAYNLNVHTCAYCNRIYTKTVSRPSKITRPSFDHWFSKGEYPLLALSFFNLIPSCSICNTGVKGSDPFNLGEHLHPYIDIDCGFYFSYYNKSTNSYGFKIVPDSGNLKAAKTSEAFKLEAIYETHLPEIKDLVNIRNVYSQSYLLDLHKFLNRDKTNVSMDEIYRLAFSTYKNESDFEKRPLSKMKRDILTELGII